MGSKKVPNLRFTPAKKAQFVEHLYRTRSLGEAANAVGMSRQAVQRHRREDPEFDAACREAWDHVIDELEQSAMDRAIHGHDEDIYGAEGEVVGTRKKHETGLTIFMLKCNRRDKYGDQVDVSLSPQDYAAQIREALEAQEIAARAALTATSNG